MASSVIDYPFPISFIKINGYRGISDIKIDKVGKINIFTGKNNVGKSSILECIYLGYKNPKNSLETIINYRGWINFNILKYLFNKELLEFTYVFKGNNNQINIKFVGEGLISTRIFNDLKEVTVNDKIFQVKYNGDEGYSLIAIDDKGKIKDSIGEGKDIDYLKDVYFLVPQKDTKILLEAYSYVIKSDSYNEFIDVLKEIYNLDDIRIILENEDVVLYVKLNNKQIPINSLGDGLKWSIILLSKIIGVKKGILLIDDFENYQHPYALKNIIKIIITSVKKSNVQIFISTHSMECLNLFLEYSNDENLDTKIHHVKKLNNDNIITTYNTIEAMKYINEIGADLRGL